MEIKSITVTELAEKINHGDPVHLVDVRGPDEYAAVRSHAVSQLLPLGDFDPSEINQSKDQAVYFICRSGRRSFEAAVQAMAAGFKDCVNVEGGTLAWQAAGLPVDSDI